MRIYFCRHGIAEDEAGEGDERRRLTEEGVKKMKKGARGLVEVVGRQGVMTILTSPLVRAEQTARIVAEAFEEEGHEVRVAMAAALKPGGSWSGVWKAVGEVKGPVMVVGHEPSLSAWIGEVTGGTVEMKKGAVAAVEVEAGGRHGLLAWLLPPGVLRGL